MNYSNLFARLSFCFNLGENAAATIVLIASILSVSHYNEDSLRSPAYFATLQHFNHIFRGLS
jgi:hypothetical protein